jgi:hypothetical protein
MSETLSYPLFLCALLAMSAALRQRSLGRHAIAVGLMALTVLTRTEMVALIPAFACAILLLSWTESRTVSGRPFWRTLWSFKWAWLVYGVGVLVLLLHAAGASVGYPDSVPTGLPEAAQLGSLLDPVRPEAIPMNVVLHIAELDLYSGIIPFAAFVLVAFSALAGRDTDRSRMEFAAVGVSAGMWLIAMAATYETTFKLHGALTTHVFDRYDFYVVPLFVIALVVWIEDGLPRPPWITVVALAAALLPLALPLDVLIDGAEWGTSTSTVGVVPLVWASELIGDGLLLKALLLFVTSVLATAFLRAERAHGWVLVRMCAVVFCMSSVLVTVSNLRLSERLREDAGHNALDWIDDAVGPSSDVAIVWPGRETNLLDERTALREAEFFNRSIGPVYDLEAPLSAGFPSTGVTLRDDNVVTAPGRQVSSTYVLAHESLGVLGNRIASDTGSGLVLYRVAGPVRVMR